MYLISYSVFINKSHPRELWRALNYTSSKSSFCIAFDLSKETERELKQGLNWKWKKCLVLKI